MVRVERVQSRVVATETSEQLNEMTGTDADGTEYGPISGERGERTNSRTPRGME